MVRGLITRVGCQAAAREIAFGSSGKVRLTEVGGTFGSSAFGFSGHAFGERFDPDYGAFMNAAGEQFLVIARFDMERDIRAIGLDDTRAESDHGPGRGGGEMFDFDFDTDGSLVFVKERHQAFTRSPFQQTDHLWRAEDGRHATAGEINAMLGLHGEAELTHHAYLGP